MVLVLFVYIFCSPKEALSLEPFEVAVIANSQEPQSLLLARYYMQKRLIPEENLIVLQTTRQEECSRQEYTTEIQIPIRHALNALLLKHRIRCLLLMYGVPLKIREHDFSMQDKIDILESKTVNSEHFSDKGKTKQNDKKQRTTRASVDSEIALVLNDTYPLADWLQNPYFLGFQNQKTLLKKNKVFMVSRLDGPTPKIVKRLINDSLATEKIGLSGRACIDARWSKPQKYQNLSAYQQYDFFLHHTADILSQDSRIEVKLDSQQELFKSGECDDTALYCGWYSLAKYQDAFEWKTGAVGYHIASAECSTLKKEKSKVWCKSMLEEGIAVTIGPVYEPYVQGFPPPDLFFSKLMEGYLNLAECYLVSLPYLSWQMILIGDPLYRPFRSSLK